MDNELISIIIPVFNTEQYIERCVRSAINQSYSNIEIIIVDDGSTDSSGKICECLAASDDRINVIHQENQGLVKSRKVGLKASNGRYIGFIDSDDWVDPNMYEYLYGKAKECDADVVTSEHYIDSEDGQVSYVGGAFKAGEYEPRRDHYFCDNMIFDENNKLWGITPNFWNKLFKKEHLEKFEYDIDERITYGEDDACVYPCMAFADKVFVSKERFYHYWRRTDSMSISQDDLYYMRINYMYISFKQKIKDHPLWSVIKKKFDLYMFEFITRGVEGLWGISPMHLIPRRVFDFSVLGDDIELNFVLYGAGKIGRNCYSQLRLLGLTDNCIWVDQKYIEMQQRGLPVKSPDILFNLEYKTILVAVLREDLFNNIRNQLVNMGIDKNKIKWLQTRDVYSIVADGWSS